MASKDHHGYLTMILFVGRVLTMHCVLFGACKQVIKLWTQSKYHKVSVDDVSVYWQTNLPMKSTSSGILEVLERYLILLDPPVQAEIFQLGDS